MVCGLAGAALRLMLAALLCACAACEPAREVEPWPLALRQLSSCQVGAALEIELVALGDFPSRRYALRADDHELAIDDVPLELRELLVRVTTASGVAQGRRPNARSARAPDAAPEGLWVLHAGRSCPLADTALRAIAGRAVTALPDGGALLVGGIDAEAASAQSQALLLVEGQELAVEVEGGMLLRRAYASATALGELVLVAGGTPDRRAGAHDNYELFDARAARFLAARSGKLKAARMQHAAVRLPDGRVLLLGGRQEPDGEPLASLELVDVMAGTSELLPGSLREPRVAPMALLLDSGSLLVLGGRDRAGQLQGSVEAFDADFRLAAGELPVHEHACAAALPGARAAWISCDHAARGGGAGCELALIRELPSELQVLPVVLDFASLVPNGLTDMRLIHVGNGQLLWTGADDSDPTGRRRAFVIDVVAQRLERVEASRVPVELLRLHNGLIAELDEAGASLRAAATAGPYASPEGDLIAARSAHLLLDAPGHWQWQDDGLRALTSGARLDLGELRFAAFRGSLTVQGDYTLWLYDGLGERASLTVRDANVELPGCRYQLRGDTRLQLARERSRLTVTGAPCSLPVADSALGIALVLEKDAVVRGLTLQRM